MHVSQACVVVESRGQCVVFDAALQLPLWQSLPVDEDREAAWASEIERRLDDVDSGRVEPISEEDVDRELNVLVRVASSS